MILAVLRVSLQAMEAVCQIIECPGCWHDVVCCSGLIGRRCMPRMRGEVKRQRRKQSNRESARRSRLRKQAECEHLAVKVKELEDENIKLKETVRMLEAQLGAAMGKVPTG